MNAEKNEKHIKEKYIKEKHIKMTEKSNLGTTTRPRIKNYL